MLLVHRKGLEPHNQVEITQNLGEFGTFVSRETEKNIKVGPLSPSLGETISSFETNLSEAILLAAKAGHFDVVRMLASELEAHRLADSSVTRARA